MCVKGVDGIERTLPPYQDTDEEGKPVMGVWLPRWIDRLDCNGSAFLGRHFLTLVNPRDEFDGEKFYQTDIVSALNPLLRPEVEIKVAGAHPLTMREHLRRYARTQSNNSPYGKHDNGTMQSLRDTNTTALNAIIGAVDRDALLGSSDIEHILGRWTTFLSGNVEPSMLGRHAAEKMRSKFGELDESTRRAWASGFDQALETYRVWYCNGKESGRGNYWFR